MEKEWSGILREALLAPARRVFFFGTLPGTTWFSK
jgi:hypothetical protein